MAKETYYFKVEVLTPVHVGTENEQLVNNRDYFGYGRYKEIAIINRRAFFCHLLKLEELDQVKKLLDDPSQYSSKIKKILSEGEESAKNITHRFLRFQHDYPFRGIRPTYWANQNGPSIPGSSIKGAIKGAFINKLLGLKGIYNHEIKDNDALQRIFIDETKKDVFANLQVSDVFFGEKDTEVSTVTIFGADEKSGKGKWKCNLENSRDSAKKKKLEKWTDEFRLKNEFKNQDDYMKMILNYETLTKGKNSKLRITINPNFSLAEDIFGSELSNFIKTAKAYTDSFIKKEKKFYYSFYNSYLNWDPDSGKNIIEVLESIRKANNEHDSFVLRVGQGGGFHNITGDWLTYSRDHLPVWGRPHPKWSKEQPFKTRKLICNIDKETGRYIFLPFGFIKCSLIKPLSTQNF